MYFTDNSYSIQIQVFSNEKFKNVRAYFDSKNTAWFNVEDVARNLGFVMVRKDRVTTSGDKYSAVRWNRINDYLKEFNFPRRVGKNDFIPENIVYRLAMKANNELAQDFQAWLADEVVPSIRKYGYYVSPKVEKEIIVETPPTEFTPPTAISAFKDITTIMQIMKQYWGMPHEIAKLKAILTIEKSYNINLDYLKDTIPSINEDEKKLFSPTQLGALTGKSAQYVNKRLCSLGFQKKDFKGGYILTDKGKEYGKLVFYETNGHKYHQIKWDYCMVRLI